MNQDQARQILVAFPNGYVDVDTAQASHALPHAFDVKVTRSWRKERGWLMSCNVHVVTLAFWDRFGVHVIHGESLDQAIGVARDGFCQMVLAEADEQDAHLDLLIDDLDAWGM
jgi:hypothetical protein